jgi:hypothetical protein
MQLFKRLADARLYLPLLGIGLGAYALVRRDLIVGGLLISAGVVPLIWTLFHDANAANYASSLGRYALALGTLFAAVAVWALAYGSISLVGFVPPGAHRAGPVAGALLIVFALCSGLVAWYIAIYSRTRLQARLRRRRDRGI